jgi:hypothetical protein
MGKYLIVGIIVVVGIFGIGGIGWFYYFIITRAGGPFVLRLLIVAGSAGLAAALIAVGIERIREIDKEDDDDLGKY